MFGAIPASFLIDYGRKRGHMHQLELPLDLPIWVFVPPEYCCDVNTGFSRANSKGETYSCISYGPHPYFENARTYLLNEGYLYDSGINSSHRYKVKKPFYFNNVYMIEEDVFQCAGYAGNTATDWVKNYNDGKILEGVKNYRDEDESYY